MTKLKGQATTLGHSLTHLTSLLAYNKLGYKGVFGRAPSSSKFNKTAPILHRFTIEVEELEKTPSIYRELRVMEFFTC
jgi:hypothetical protein